MAPALRRIGVFLVTVVLASIAVFAVLAGVQLILKSPGLAPGDERIAAPLARAVATGIPVQGELDLFARALAELKAARGRFQDARQHRAVVIAARENRKLCSINIDVSACARS